MKSVWFLAAVANKLATRRQKDSRFDIESGGFILKEGGLATLDRKMLLTLARVGAEARIRELQNEIATIRSTFGMRGSSGAAAATGGGPGKRSKSRKRGKLSAAGRRAIVAAQKARWAAIKAGKGGAKKRKGMSPAARKAVSERMRKYWAARRKSAK